MKRTWYFLFVILLVSCAKKGPEAHWPAKITAFDGLTADQQTELRQYIQDLNTRAGQTIVTESGDGFPIHVTVVPAPASQPQRAGYSILSDDNCEIQLSSFMLTTTRQDYLESVFVHELGHCGGLGHTAQVGSVMYPTTARWDSYSQQQLSSFVTSFMDSIKSTF